AHAVYVEVSGTLGDILVKPGDRVVAGQPLARLVNLEVQLEIDRLTARRDETRVTIASLRKERFADATADARLSVTEHSLAAYERLLTERQADAERLL